MRDMMQMVRKYKKLGLGVGAGLAVAAIAAGAAFVDVAALRYTQPPQILTLEDITLTSATHATRNAVSPDGSPTPQITQSGNMRVVPTGLDEDTFATASAEGPHTSVTPSCEIKMTSRARVAAMVSVEIHAPCRTAERFVLHHNGMMFSALTDGQGRADLTVPALTENGVFIAAFGNGDGAMVQQRVEDLAQYARAVVQWRGETGLGLHAREFGAPYFAPGHVHKDAAGSLADAALGQSGLLMRFGTGPDPLMAEIYTYPIAATDTPGTIALSVEAEITSQNCGAAVEAQTLQLSEDQSLAVKDLVLHIPECEAAGDFLVLNNLLEHMTLAAK